ncbi:hypothetical protein PSCLAVI8L_150024 [Pseudoclavibacter sp. 8L]|nr:hypothetical protein PSCLAVI8L_150024 [Pseudoclavibacter sp. 8L]
MTDVKVGTGVEFRGTCMHTWKLLSSLGVLREGFAPQSTDALGTHVSPYSCHIRYRSGSSLRAARTAAHRLEPDLRRHRGRRGGRRQRVRPGQPHQR